MKRNKYHSLKVALFIRTLVKGKLSVRKLWNVAVCSISYWLKRKTSGTAPFILSLELWNECNAGCLFCRDKKGKIHNINSDEPYAVIEKGKMDLAVACSTINQVKHHTLISVLYTNGEPLLYKDLAHVIEFSTKNHMATMISTNGLLFTQENSEAILKAGIDLIKIQLSGFTQDIYSIQIRYGHVERLKENISRLAKINRDKNYGTIILVDYILYEYNKHQLPLIKEFCEELGVMLNTRPGNPGGGLEDIEKPLTTETLPLNVNCDWLWKGMQVNWNGDILQCCEGVIWSNLKPYDTITLGRTNVLDTWNGPAAQAMRAKITHQGRGAIPVCAKCLRKGVEFKW